MILKINLCLFLFFFLAQTMINPSTLLQTIKSIAPPQIKVLTLDLGRTINGYTIMAYGITSIQGLQSKQDLRKYPSSLMTSFLHPYDDFTLDLQFLTLQIIFDKFEKDYQLQTMLKNGFMWMIPFVNIDSYEMLIVEKKLSHLERTKFHKNMNKAMETKNFLNGNCQEDHMNGVNIDNNFWQKYSQSEMICKDFYGGDKIISERESQALVSIFQTLNITVFIDLQTQGDFIVYPNSIYYAFENTSNPKHPYLYLYSNIINKLHNKGYLIGSNEQLRSKEHKGGGLIEWASSKGVLSFTYMVGTSQNMDNREILDRTIGKNIEIIEFLLKRNNALYEKFKNQQNSKLYIINVGVLQFHLKCQVLYPEQQQSFQSTYLVSLDTPLQIDFHPNVRTIFNLTILETQLNQIISLEDIHLTHKQVQKHSPQSSHFTLPIFLCFSFIFIILLMRLSKRKQQELLI